MSLVKRHLTFTASLLSILISAPSLAQTPEEVFNAYYKDWFQVEVILFERLERPNNDPEAWPKNVELKYPTNIEFLVDPFAVEETPDEISSNELNGEGELTQLADTETSSLNASQETETLSQEDIQKNREFLELLKKGGANDAFTKKLLDALSESEIARLTPKELPYHFLDESLRQLNDEAKRLGRDRNMRLLFHNAWRQPFYSKEDAPGLVLTGGDNFEDHYELEGTITLFLSRYLHIHTNLWLTQFDANTGDNESHWRWLPERPMPEKDTPIIDNLSLSETPTDQTNNFNTNINTSNDNSSFNSNSSFNGLGELSSLNTGFDSDSLSFNFDNNESTNIFDDFGNFIEHPYVIRQIVTVKQNRRMRSGELHYIDHPRLGILLKIDRYQPEFSENTSE